ncbi:MAG: hypothetical protein P8O16_19685 [Algoriphagus sp.]|uniref:hypothetical protein n=1 Tax=Algoriphagus sp. TaxID=1872435 RepID=UPI00260D4446|nr:hypothetical protein [Algoriphagus sp.]MDG1279502.1 hypothetical protein [Algoriphagus sp.]
MIESILKLLGIYFLSWFKFIAGPVLGTAAGYSVIQTILVTVSGMMSSVVVFTFIGARFKKFIEIRFPKPKFSKKNRNIVKIWKKYGEMGIAAITPLLLTPIGGTLIMVSFGVKKRRIFIQMLISSILWATFFSLTIDSILKIPFFNNLFL